MQAVSLDQLVCFVRSEDQINDNIVGVKLGLQIGVRNDQMDSNGAKGPDSGSIGRFGRRD